MSNPVDISSARVRRIHFIGVGGIGMSALARLFLSEGKIVTGSDRSPSAITDALVSEGLHFFPVQDAANITGNGTDPLPDLVVYTEAMPKDHPEVCAAHAQGIPTMNYFAALGLIANQYKLIAVSGSHGKTTTTAMLINIFEAAGLDPSAVVGSLRTETKSNYRKGKSQYFIAEACEYRRDFLSLTPDVLVITNIELEHVDYYKTLDEVQAAFCEFVGKVREGGTVVLNESDDAVRPVATYARTLGLRVVDSVSFFDPLSPLRVPGIHNRLNAASAAAASSVCGISKEVAQQALADFRGTWRRFEYKGDVQGAKVYDDYGHHPTEIKATIAGVRELYPDRMLTLIFQPHTYTRTDALFHDFVSALRGADRVYLTPIYAAREENVSGVTHEKLAAAVGEHHANVHAYADFETVATTIRTQVSERDVVLVMGAGDITNLASRLIV